MPESIPLNSSSSGPERSGAGSEKQVRLSAGTKLSARVVSDLGGGRYEAAVSGTSAHGDNVETELVLQSSSFLKVGQKLNLSVVSGGTAPVLEVVGSSSTLIAENAGTLLSGALSMDLPLEDLQAVSQMLSSIESSDSLPIVLDTPEQAQTVEGATNQQLPGEGVTDSTYAADTATSQVKVVFDENLSLALQGEMADRLAALIPNLPRGGEVLLSHLSVSSGQQMLLSFINMGSETVPQNGAASATNTALLSGTQDAPQLPYTINGASPFPLVNADQIRLSAFMNIDAQPDNLMNAAGEAAKLIGEDSSQPQPLPGSLTPGVEHAAVVAESSPGSAHLLVITDDGSAGIDVKLNSGIQLYEGAELTVTPGNPHITARGEVSLNLPTATVGLQNEANQNAIRNELSSVIESLGLNSTESSLSAASALVREGVTISRENLLAVSSAAARVAGEMPNLSLDEASTIAARAIANDLPLHPAILRGMAANTFETLGITSQVEQAQNILTEFASAQASADSSAAFQQIPTSASDALNLAAETLSRFHLPVDNNLSQSLQQFMLDQGGNLLQSSIAQIENASEAILSSNTQLQNFDTLIGQFLQQVSTNSTPAERALLLQNLPEEVSRIVENIVSQTAGRALSSEEVSRLAAQVRPEHASAVLAALEANERAVIESDPVLTRLSASHQALNSASESITGMKAENVANTVQNRNPSVFVAEIPLKFNSENTSGKLEIYWRKGSAQGPKRWSSRVVLDLDMSNLGPVISDLRFTRSRLDIIVGTADEDSSSALKDEAETLVEALSEKGFNPKLDFRVLVGDELTDEEKLSTDDPWSANELPHPGDGHLDVQV